MLEGGHPTTSGNNVQRLYDDMNQDDSVDAMGLDMILHIGDHQNIITQVRIQIDKRVPVHI